LQRDLMESIDGLLYIILHFYYYNLENCCGLSIVDPIWETIDPNPNLQTLYNDFNERIFSGMLPEIEVKWSNRMTRATGACYPFFNEEGNCVQCRIYLSKPILELRPRRDTVETLLHEMIHAFQCFRKTKDEGDDHGPNFQNFVEILNNSLGTNITVSITHCFYEEVEALKRHWWECDGPCQKVVKRARNMAPSNKERWFREHEQTCGGNFIKISEPETPVRKKRNSKKATEPEYNTSSSLYPPYIIVTFMNFSLLFILSPLDP
uniref:SprT-like domain-containing protein n=1 Tax=Xenopus tropicalis TaxID=8364 RepID=A0A6I8QKR3_XENTR